MIPDGRRVPLPPGNGAARGTLLVDGTYRADWRLTRPGDPPGLDVTPFTLLTRTERAEIAEEGTRLLTLLSPDSAPGTAEVRID